MQTSPVPTRDPSAATLSRAEAICKLLRDADALTARAIELIGRGGDMESSTALPMELVLELDGRRMGSEARLLVQTAAELRQMPLLAAAVRDGLVSMGQLRAIVGALRRLPAAARPPIDALIGRHAAELSDADPDRLVQIVDDACARLRPDLEVAREDRAVAGNFLAIQPRLDGRSSIYGQADAVSTATIVEAIDAAAEDPVHPDSGVTRAQQCFDGLLAICEDSLAGGNQKGTRPRPRILATFDVADLDAGGHAQAMRLLWNLTGRPVRLSPVVADELLCDPTIVPIITYRGRPIAVGDAATPVTGKLRSALIARDGGCRFPGCHAPAGWCDSHHIIARRGRQITDVCLLCRRHHRLVHRRTWKIRVNHDDTITFTWRGRRYTSHPRHRSPPPALE